MRKLVHVIGAGLAGLAAAVQLQRRGAQVVLHEAAAHAGGRCRSYYDDKLGATLDSGNHILLSGHTATLNYLRAIGAADELSGPARPELPFVDLATHARWTLRMSPGHLPWWVFDHAARVPGTGPADYLALAPLLFAKPGRSVAQTMRCDGPLWDRLVRPLLHALLKMEPRDASAEMSGALLRDALLAGGLACRPLIARRGLGSAFVDPALRLLQYGGATIRFGSRLRAIVPAPGGARVEALSFVDGDVTLDAQHAAIVALPADVAPGVVPGLHAPTRFAASTSVHFAYAPAPASLAGAPLTVLLNGTAAWLFAFDERLSVTLDTAGRAFDVPPDVPPEVLQNAPPEVPQNAPHEVPQNAPHEVPQNAPHEVPQEAPPDVLAATAWADVQKAARLPATPLPAWQVVTERRATFAALPDQQTLRPGTRTRWNNLMLAGDWTATGLPATIEGAIRSGQKAADTLLNEPMERR